MCDWLMCQFCPFVDVNDCFKRKKNSALYVLFRAMHLKCYHATTSFLYIHAMFYLPKCFSFFIVIKDKMTSTLQNRLVSCSQSNRNSSSRGSHNKLTLSKVLLMILSLHTHQCTLLAHLPTALTAVPHTIKQTRASYHIWKHFITYLLPKFPL